MFDLSLAAFVYSFLAVAAITVVVAVAAIVVAVRDRAAAGQVLVTVSGHSERAFTRAA